MKSKENYLPLSQCASQEVTVRDEELLLAARAGSHAAFAELQNIHANRLYRRIFSMTRNREDTEDALQDTFLRAFRGLPSFQGRSRFSSWLTRIAINSALMILRKRRVQLEVSFESGIEEDGSRFEVHDNSPGPEQLYDQRQRCEAALIAIQRLGPKLRNVMHCRISQEKSMEQIAHGLGVSVASVKASIHRARKRLVKSPAFRDRSGGVNQSNRAIGLTS